MAFVEPRDLPERAPLAFPYAPVELPRSIEASQGARAQRERPRGERLARSNTRAQTASSREELRLGRRTWVIAEGYIPGESTGPAPAMTSHETACILNPNREPARIEITIYFADRDPVGPYRVTVEAERTLHLRFNSLKDPQPIPRDTDYASVFRSNLPVVIQHTRLDSRQPPHALLTTMGWGE